MASESIASYLNNIPNMIENVDSPRIDLENQSIMQKMRSAFYDKVVNPIRAKKYAKEAAGTDPTMDYGSLNNLMEPWEYDRKVQNVQESWQKMMGIGDDNEW